MRFFVLGPIHVRVGGAVPSLAAPTLRILLGCLLARPNAPVSFDEVIDALWGDKPVPNARQRLHVHVHRLRRLLGDPSRIACQNATYRLCLQPGELDAETFESMLDEAGALTRAGHDDRAAATIREALGLWDGPAYVGLDHVPVLRAEADRLTERRLVAFEDLCAAEVAADRGGAMIAEMRDLAAQYPPTAPTPYSSHADVRSRAAPSGRWSWRRWLPQAPKPRRRRGRPARTRRRWSTGRRRSGRRRTAAAPGRPPRRRGRPRG